MEIGTVFEAAAGIHPAVALPAARWGRKIRFPLRVRVAENCVGLIDLPGLPVGRDFVLVAAAVAALDDLLPQHHRPPCCEGSAARAPPRLSRTGSNSRINASSSAAACCSASRRVRFRKFSKSAARRRCCSCRATRLARRMGGSTGAGAGTGTLALVDPPNRYPFHGSTPDSSPLWLPPRGGQRLEAGNHFEKFLVDAALA